RRPWWSRARAPSRAPRTGTTCGCAEPSSAAHTRQPPAMSRVRAARPSGASSITSMAALWGTPSPGKAPRRGPPGAAEPAAAVGPAVAGEGAGARASRGGGAGGGGGGGRGGRGRPAPGVPAAAGGGDQNQGEERGRTHRPSIRTRRAGGRPRLKFLPAPARSPLRVRELRRLGRRSAALLQVGHVVGLVAVRLDLAALDRLLELALHVADAARGRDAERLHDGVAEPGRQRRHPRVLLAQALDPPLQLAYLPEQELAPAGALGGDVGAG